MSGGLHPCAKYEHVVAEDCCPMKLEPVAGVDGETWPLATVLLLFTPAPPMLREFRFRLPFGDRADRPSPPAADPVTLRPPGVTACIVYDTTPACDVNVTPVPGGDCAACTPVPTATASAPANPAP